MVRRVVWTERAQKERKEILAFWIENNHSKSYSRKLNQQFKQAINLLKIHPNIGKPTDIKNVRIKIVSHYMVFYELINNELIILTIWDSRQDSERLNVKNRN